MRYGLMIGLLFASSVLGTGCQQAQPEASKETAVVETIPPRRGRMVVRDGQAVWLDEPLQFHDE